MRSKLLAVLLMLSLMLGSFIPALAKGESFEAEIVDVIVHTAKPYRRVIQAIESLGGTVTFQYQNVGGLAAQIPADKLGELQAVRGVEMVEKDLMIQLPEPVEDYLGVFPLEIAGSELLGPSELAEQGIEPTNYYSYLSSVTGAEDTWGDTGAGAGSIVAVIDTGTQATHVCLAGRVIEGPDFSTDVGTPFEGSILATNYYHGTFAAGQVASLCAFIVVAGDPFEANLPEVAKIDIGGGLFLVPLYGIAPLSSIYAVKAFPHTGAGTSSSRINASIDHVITQKVTGALDIDVINMSLGGASLNDGKSFQEKLVDAATDAGIVVAVAAGNEGPSPNTVARPGTAYTAVTVGATTDPVHTRIYWDYFIGPGAGSTLYPMDELRISDFSGQGPYADGRRGPDIVATGVFNFSPSTSASGTAIGWSSGTSFSTPQVAGAAALLSAWAENNDPGITAKQIRNALFNGAVPMDSEWDVQSQGYGFLNVPNALDLLMNGKVDNGVRHDSSGGKLKPNVKFNGGGMYSENVTLERGRWVDWVFEIGENTESVIIEIEPDGGLIPPGPSGAFGFDESFELYVKSAKHGGVEPDFVNSANVFNDAMVEISAGSVVLSGGIGGNLVTSPPSVLEPGLMKVTLQSDWTNNTEFLSAEVTITLVEGSKGNNAGGVTATLGDLETQVFAFEVPEGTDQVTFMLTWKHDWTKVPTNDLDLFFVSPSSFPFLDTYFDGATLNSPEKQVILNPEAGTWYILVDGFQVQNGRDPYVLEVILE